MRKKLPAIPSLTVAAVVLAVPITLLIAQPGSSAATSATSDTVVSDASITSAQAQTNFGTGAYVTTDGSPTRYGYFSFTAVVPSGQTVTKAVFRCWAGSSNAAGGTLRAVSSAWSEKLITWDNAPKPNLTTAALGATGPVTAQTWASVDVTAGVPRSGTYTFSLSTTSTTAWSCASRENTGGHPASLQVTTSGSPITTPAPPTTTPAPPTTTPAPPTTTPVPPPTGHKVLVIPLENHGSAQVTAQMPNLTAWGKQYGQATDYAALVHPSLPNYLAIFGGSTFGVTSDCSVGAAGCVPTAPSVWGQTLAAGKTAKAYQESMSGNCATGGASNYAPRHGPWAYWTSTAERPGCTANDVPSGTTTSGALINDVNAGALPITGELTPNLCNDAHNCSLATADTWLAGWMPKLLAGPDFAAGRLTIIITFDENDGSAGNKVSFVVIDPRLHAKTVTAAFNHYSLARWLADNAGVARLRNAATAPDLRAAFGL